MASELEVEIGRKLKELGGDQSATRAAGYSRSSVSRVAIMMKKGWDPEGELKSKENPAAIPEGKDKKTEGKDKTVPDGKAKEEKEDLKPKNIAAARPAIEVGKITITPENWGMTQYGAILILDTYNRAKRDINYDGTMGDFLCDMCEFYRRILNYKEVEYVRTSGEGGDGHQENAQESLGAGTRGAG